MLIGVCCVVVLELRSHTDTAWQLLIGLAERSAAALQEYSCTGDVEAVLRVYRHLVATQDDHGGDK